jgi:sulfofructose kinase
MDVVGVGLNATDTVIPLPQFPESGSKVEFHSVSVLPGGQVASAMVACQHWGLSARYVGKLGDDIAADLHRTEFDRAGVESKLMIATDCASQQAFIMVDETGERTVLWKRDNRVTLRPEELKREWVVDARALHLDGHDTEAAIQAATWAHEAGIPIILDLDKLYPGVEELLYKTDYLIVSRNIPEDLTGNTDLHKALVEIQQRFGCRLTAATLGSDGVLAWDCRRFYYVPTYHVEVVDTTGAGDIFHAGFIYGLLQGWLLPQILDFACAAAALNCTGLGARGGIQSVDKIEYLMATGSRYAPYFETTSGEPNISYPQPVVPR